MRRSLSLLALAVGSGLLVASAFAEPNKRAPKILRVSLAGTDFDYTDPALAYFQPSWVVGYATCLKLMNYPDAPAPKGLRLIPEASLPPRVSRRGRRYTFTIRRGLRFNTGERVTPESFAKALYRVLKPRLSSPGFSFVRDIVGADAVNMQRAGRAGGIRVRGRSLIVDLRRPAPDFLQRIALPFFCATATGVPLKEGGVTVVPGAGPYYIAARRIGGSLVLRRNRFYRGPRPHHVDAIVYSTNQPIEDSWTDVQAGRSDWAAGGLPTRAYAKIVRRYGVNRRRFWVNTTISVRFLFLNSLKPPFSDPQVRRAVNYVVNRIRLARSVGAFAGVPTDDYLPPVVRGSRNPRIYPLRATAASIARGQRLVRGRVSVQAILLSAPNSLFGRLVRQALEQLGFTVYGLPLEPCRGPLYRCQPDAATVTWATAYPGAAEFLLTLLGNPTSTFPVAEATRAKVEALKKLRRRTRDRAAQKLALELAKMDAPVVPLYVPRDRNFFSARVGCVTYQPVYGIDLAALCLR